MRPASGIPGHIDYAIIKSALGGESVLQFRSYDQKREAWQGTERDGVWMDEEPPMEIYTEALMRTMTTKGMLLCTFTPLMGLSEVALSFMPELAPAA
jgi:phage terminase large subunit-like protein